MFLLVQLFLVLTWAKAGTAHRFWYRNPGFQKKPDLQVSVCLNPDCSRWHQNVRYCFTSPLYSRIMFPPFSLIRDFGKKKHRGNVSKISVSLTCYRHVGSKSTNHSRLSWRREGQKVTLVAVIGGFRSDMSITCKTDGNFGNVSAGVLFFKFVNQRKQW